ncbi:ABC transporter ATP-binding protein [Paenibacillus eucommiae]|uniref:ABC-type multidrug transport system ATPase subunit n=1 Tax=Paenibacillus eucommiae TaxID=1355755 RepID=A0ABS4IMI7_9BACL|nr:ABC transporter ATP-binding protein [Paenibacillus eucommiae]MBP1988770.1 ABC-type multidrug transport system ATPase subunit [Paenibacillus eucommiae]
MQIQITNLGKTYGSFQAMSGVTLTIQKGIFGLLGPNGAGKSTLMQILSTLQPATEGSVAIGDYKLGRDDQAIRAMLGYLPQEFGLYNKLSGYEYLDYVAMMKGMTNSRKRKEAVVSMLEQVNMSEKAKKRVGSYSGGMKQRIGIAQALLGSPQLIIVDEPTAGLDLEERIRFRHVLRDLSTDRIVILSTHIVADIENACNQLAMMKQGRIVYQGTQESLLDQVKGRVWTGNVGESQFDAIKQQMKVISARKAAYGQEIRVLSDIKPFEGAEPARIGLEDAYVNVIRGEELQP